MRIGYPCINRSLASRCGGGFRLASFTPARFRATVAANLAGLAEMVAYNRQHGMLFLRISSDLVPFASHPVCTLDWAREFAAEFASIGRSIREGGLRISMHPDQFTLLNAANPEIVTRSIAELDYHARVLEALGLDLTARLQIHVGGVYGDRPAAMARFIQTWPTLPPRVRERLVIENDDRQYPLADCLTLHAATGVPVLFDFFHHALLNRGEPMPAALRQAAATWTAASGLPMCDYSSQEPGARKGAHAEHLDAADFAAVLLATRPTDFDLMLEIKDKEQSAARALAIARQARDPRLAAAG